jgi:ornithine carbamoyltransferase
MAVKTKAKVSKKTTTKSLSVSSLLSISQLTFQDVDLILRTAAEFKMSRDRGKVNQPLKGKVMAAVFEKSSTRTRVSFETAMYQLGGTMLYLAGRDLQYYYPNGYPS